MENQEIVKRRTPCPVDDWTADPRERRSARKRFLKYIARVGTNEHFERILIPIEDEPLVLEAIA
jgi:hypothetical protein